MRHSLPRNKAVYICSFSFLLIMTSTASAQSSQQLYNEVQSLYGSYQSMSSNDCFRVKSVVAQIERYRSSRAPVPADKAYSVRFPNQVPNPTIGDLANDRSLRLRDQFKSCFATNNANAESMRLYNEVQNLYGRYQTMSKNDCGQVTSVVSQLGRYLNNGMAVPADKAYTVRFPNTVQNPTIGQLAADRQLRLKQQFESCYSGPAIDRGLQASLVGTWKFKQEIGDFQMTITSSGGRLSANLDQHRYSYPPVFKEVSSLAPNGVGIRFTVGPQHHVDYQIFENNNTLNGYVTPSWDPVGKPISLTKVNPTAPTVLNTPPPPRPRATAQAATADIIWRHRNGQVHYWPMSNGKRTGGINIYTPVDRAWFMRGVGDVNGDGTDDLIWQHQNGQVHYWPMRGGNRTGGINIYSPVGPDWTLKGSGDVNGDGTADIVWQHRNGQVHYWPMRGGERTGGFDIYSPVGPVWALKGVGDVNGDGTDDIVWQHQNGQVHYWPMRGGDRTGGIDIFKPVGAGWLFKGVGDVNGDRTDDIVWQRDNGQVHYWPMRRGVTRGGTNIHTPVGSDWSLMGVGDVNR